MIEAVKSGAIRHIFLVGGCDGAHPGRNYYTEFVKQTPMDTLVLTLACGKYRFNDLDLGEIGGLPRIFWTWASATMRTALSRWRWPFAEAFSCTVNELPLTLVLSWYEQKAVCILLTLLALGVKKTCILGPTLPAFMSETIVKTLVDAYGLAADHRARAGHGRDSPPRLTTIPGWECGTARHNISDLKSKRHCRCSFNPAVPFIAGIWLEGVNSQPLFILTDWKITLNILKSTDK